MAKNSIPLARNQIRRSLRAILDPHPTPAEVEELWEYFGRACAYCGVHLARADRSGHTDHVLAQSTGGSNGIYNHVLSCGRCNGDEKREEPWDSFLSRKAGPEHLATRRERITAWLARATERPATPPEVKAAAEKAANEAIAAFDVAVQKIRALRVAGA
jgi:hypothetical protein